MDTILNRLADINRFFDYFKTLEFYVSLIIILAAVLIYIFIKKATALFLKFPNKISKTVYAKGITKTGKNIVKAVLFFIALIAILQVNGINVTGVVASLGIVSAIVGLALQDFLKDIVMGVHIASDKFFSVGDVVRYKEKEGIVASFTLKTTKIVALDDKSIISVCNRNIEEIAKVGDLVNIDVPLEYEENPKKIHQVLGAVTEEIGKIDGIYKSTYRGTQEFADSAVIYRITFYCDAKIKYGKRREALKLIQETLIDNNLTIPYNHMDINIKQ